MKRKHSKNPLTLLIVDYFFPVHVDYDLFFLLYLELQRSAEQMMRCESTATQGLRSVKTATKRRALERTPLSPRPLAGRLQTCTCSLLAWHPVAVQP